MRVNLADWKCSTRERELINKVLDSGWLTYGPYCKELERVWSDYHGCKYGVVNSSGTAALQLAFTALKELYKWSDDAEVICPAITFPATINMVIASGLKPVLCDVTEAEAMIDIKDLAKRITGRTKAVCLVHLWGTPYPYKEELLAFCKSHGLKIVEDSCETIDRKVGNWGEVSCFSMYFNHIISAGVGGMACTNDPRLEDIMRSLANHGMADTKVIPKYKRFRFVRIGHSMRITEFEAALAVAQWEKIDEILAKRVKVRDTLTAGLKAIGVDDMARLIGGTMMYPILFKGCISGPRKSEFMDWMDKQGVEMREAMPITNQSCYSNLVNDYQDYPVARYYNNCGVFFPVHPMMGDEHCEHIVSTINRWRDINGFNGREAWLVHGFR
jgi:dTDP-4-amino-4,6-dideoxygalactose transaminase